MKSILPLLLIALVGTGCVAVSVNRTDNTAGKTPSNAQQLLDVDRAFARLANEQGAAVAFARYTDADSLRVTPVGPLVRGTDAIRAEVANLPAGALTWEPQQAEIARSGELGWTWGDYRLTEAKGNVTGRYVTVWRKRDGAWRIAADIGTQANP